MNDSIPFHGMFRVPVVLLRSSDSGFMILIQYEIMISSSLLSFAMGNEYKKVLRV